MNKTTVFVTTVFLKLKFTIFCRIILDMNEHHINYFRNISFSLPLSKMNRKIVLKSEVSTTKLICAKVTDTSPCFQNFISDICSYFEWCSRTFQKEGFLGHVIFRAYDPLHKTALKMAFSAFLTFTHSQRRVIHPAVSAFYKLAQHQ